MADAILEDGSASKIPPTGVPTTYAGVTFRSRLEACWAAFADNASWHWVYEPFDGDGYIPDFCFTIAGRPVLVEVKPVATAHDARAYLPKVLAGIGNLWNHDAIVCGIDPLQTLYLDFLNGPDDYHSTPAEFSVCPHCGELNLHPQTWSMVCSRCPGNKVALPQTRDYVNMLWRKAGNDTRWIPAA